MTDITFTYDRVAAMRPSADLLLAATEKLGGVAVWKARGFSFREMADARVPLDDLVWLATEASQLDPDIARRVNLWGADCAAHVLPIFEREMPGDTRPRDAIEAARGLARGTVSDAAMATALDAAWAAWAAARDAASAAWGDVRAALAAARAAVRYAWGDVRAAARDAASAALAAAWAAARDAASAAWGDVRAALAAARDAERRWQLDRLCCWLSEQEPQDWPLSEEGRA